MDWKDLKKWELITSLNNLFLIKNTGLLILKKLIKQKVKIDVEDYDQRNAFHWAASSGKYS